jgi:CheY-like chemotaxis protein
LLCEIVESEGCEVIAASNGTDALALFEAGNFDAVFTDIGMPGMSGWELARHPRPQCRTPARRYHGLGRCGGSDEQKAAQVNWVVTNPFSMQRVSEIIRDLGQRKDKLRLSEMTTVAA